MSKKIFVIALMLVLINLMSNIVLAVGESCKWGVECNAYGNPPEDKMASCIKGKCVYEEINARGPSCWQGGYCGCNVQQCELDCLAKYKNYPDGHYTLTETCKNCGQEFTCGCDIEKPKPRTYCGDGIRQYPNSFGVYEQCDFGSQNGVKCDPKYGDSCNWCSKACKLLTEEGPYCGDGHVDSGEECDDGNNINGDGCSAFCKIEDGCVDGFKTNNLGLPLSDWKITATSRKTGETWTVETIGSGYYKIDTLPIGYYDISEEMQEGWQVAPGGRLTYYNVYVGPKTCAVHNYNFVNMQIPKEGCVEGIKHDKQEVPMGGWTIYLREKDNPSAKIYTKTTSFVKGKEGTYKFDDLPVGWYDIWEEEREGWKSMIPLDGHTIIEVTEEEECAFVYFKNELLCKDECSPGDFCVGEELWSCEIQDDGCYDKVFKKDCSSYEDDLFCRGEDIVETKEKGVCVEEGSDAYCDFVEEVIVKEECGPDTCTGFTEMDPFVKEYVFDEESCEENPEGPACAEDVNRVDYCIDDTDVVRQFYCEDEDAAYEDYDCNSNDGCYAFKAEICVMCGNGADCKKTMCNVTGYEMRDYFCGDGACDYVTLEMVDIDSDKIDDRCPQETCIDVDHDGICDDVDNCVGVPNPNQIDYDHDGIGNACDLDRDDDGYPEPEDCNDWNADIHPGAEEIKNNDRDDDCDPNTPDKGVYAPRQTMYVSTKYDESELVPGGVFPVLVTVENTGVEDLENLKILVSIPGMQILQTKTVYNLEAGEKKSVVFYLDIPRSAYGYDYLRISVGNDEYKRLVYREIKYQKGG